MKVSVLVTGKRLDGGSLRGIGAVQKDGPPTPFGKPSALVPGPCTRDRLAAGSVISLAEGGRGHESYY